MSICIINTCIYYVCRQDDNVYSTIQDYYSPSNNNEYHEIKEDVPLERSSSLKAPTELQDRLPPQEPCICNNTTGEQWEVRNSKNTVINLSSCRPNVMIVGLLED